MVYQLKHSRAVSLLGVNIVAIIAVSLTQLPTNRLPEWKEALRMLIYALVYTNAAAVPAILWMPRLIHLSRRKLPNIPVIVPVVVGCMFFTVLGCFVGGGIFVWAGLAPAARLWSDTLNILRFSGLLAVAFGLGVFAFENTREQLRQTTQKLHERELAAERAGKLAAEARLASLESRIHPHFLFNTLNCISSLIPIDPHRAEDVVNRLAGLLRSSLDATRHSTIPLEEELEMVENYFGIENARFGGKVNLRFEVPLELRNVNVPPLAIQTLIENSVKHGIAPQGAGEVRVSASDDGERLRISVSDSGPGFNLKDIPAGHGLDNLTSRLDALYGPEAHLGMVQRNGSCVVEMILPRSRS